MGNVSDTGNNGNAYRFLVGKAKGMKALGMPTYGHHHHLPPWIRSFDLFRHRRIAIVSWGIHDLFFLEVCS